jgi:hypothetical protein
MSANTAADQAVYQLQLNLADAVRYVSRNARVSQEVAEKAVKDTITFYR